MDGGTYYALNEVGDRTWELCDGTHSMAQLVRILAKEYDAPTDILEADIVELLEDLSSKNLIVGYGGEPEGYGGEPEGSGGSAGHKPSQ